MTARKPLDEITQLALSNLQDSLEEVQAEIKAGKAKETKLKALLLKIHKEHEFPNKSDKSEWYGRLKVTLPQADYKLDWKKFIEIFGMEAFLRFFEIEDATMNVDLWTEAIRNEEFLESDLRACIIEPRSLGPRVRLMKTEDEGEEDD